MNSIEKTKTLFSQFEPELAKKIQQVGTIRKFKAEDFLMKTGQSIRSAVLVLDGIIKSAKLKNVHEVVRESALQSALGLTTTEAENAFARAMVRDARLSAADIETILAATAAALAASRSA